MEENTTPTPKPKLTECAAQIILAQALCVAILLLAVVAVKTFFTGYYPALSDWYARHICAETEIDEVLSPSEAEDAV